jgi:hypothetical protein
VLGIRTPQDGVAADDLRDSPDHSVEAVFADATIDARMPRLIATSDEARRAIAGESHTIDRLPFRVGRESRSVGDRLASQAERRRGTVGQVNDVYLLEDPLAQSHHISREHFLIDAGQGLFYVVDRQSACGTIVAGRMVGGDRIGGRVELHDQDVIVAGTSASPYSFRFVVS